AYPGSSSGCSTAAATRRTCSPRPTSARTRGRSPGRTTSRRHRADAFVTPAAVDHREAVPPARRRELTALVRDVAVPHRDELPVLAPHDPGGEVLDRIAGRPLECGLDGRRFGEPVQGHSRRGRALDLPRAVSFERVVRRGPHVVVDLAPVDGA